MKEEQPLERLAHELARALPNGATNRPDVAVTDEQLLAYRAGQRSDDVERALAHSPAARARLLELANVMPPAPPAALRRKIVGVESPRRWIAAAAAVVITGVLSAWLLNSGPRSTAPSLAAMNYQMSVQGLALARGGEGLPTAFADTTVNVVVVPDISSRAALEFGLYAGQSEWLTRIEPVSMVVEGGAADLRFRPDQVADLSSGTLHIGVRVSVDTSMPEKLRVGDTKTLFSRLTIIERTP